MIAGDVGIVVRVDNGNGLPGAVAGGSSKVNVVVAVGGLKPLRGKVGRLVTITWSGSASPSVSINRDNVGARGEKRPLFERFKA